MDLNRIFRVVGSLRFAAVILVMLCIAMACATVYEAAHGTPAALEVFYKSPWFEALLWLLALNVLASALARYPWSRRHVGFLLTHASILAILGGAWVTEHYGINGQVAIAEGQSAKQFRTDQGSLTLRKAGEQNFATADLSGGVGGLRPLTAPATPAVTLGTTRGIVEAYWPHTTWEEQIVNDNPTPSVALQISLANEGESSRTWVFADDSDPGHRSISVKAVSNQAEFERALATPTTQPAGKQTVKLEIKDAAFEFPLDQCVAGAVPAGDTGYSVKVLRYLPHAQVGENKQLTSVSNQPLNPAIEAEITGPNGTSKRLAFARFPDFGSMHGTQDPAADVKLIFVSPVEEATSTPIELVAGPAGQIAARFKADNGQSTVQRLEIGKSIETPWRGLNLSVVRRFDNARRQSVIQPVESPGEDRTPAIKVSLHTGQDHHDVWVRKYEPQTIDLAGTRYELTYDDKRLPLGFEVRLNKFVLGTYPGSNQPRSFESHVTIVDSQGSEESRVISMNHPAKIAGYSLFQSSYQQSRSGPTTTVLSVSWDPGQPIVFGGYITVVLGMLYVLVNRMRARRKDDEGSVSNASTEVNVQPAASASHKSAAVLASSTTARIIGMLVAVSALWPSAPTHAANAAGAPANLDMSLMRALPMQHNGRWMPLDTVARDTITAVTGTAFFDGIDPVNLLLAWTFSPETWASQPLISISSAELRQELKLASDRSRFSFNELVSHQPLREQMDRLAERQTRGKMNPLESKVNDIQAKLVDLQEAFRNQVIKPIPDATSTQGAWKPITLNEADAGAYTPAQKAWSSLKTAYLSGNATAFLNASQELSKELAQLPAAYRPAAGKIATELWYNRLAPYSIAWKLMCAGVILAAVSLIVKRRAFDVLVILVMLAGFGMLTYGLGLRWQIAGRIPAANMFESLLFLSWGSGAFAIPAMLLLKDRLVPLTASATGALALFLAANLPIDQFIRPIAPVLLDTVWMSIHVPGIMLSYFVLALAALVAHVQMAIMAAAPDDHKLIDRVDAMHHWFMHVGVILLGAGIITGSMWAASSWGRYWGWDPKEVWSLIAFLAYLVIMHVRVDRERMPAWSYALAAALGAGLYAVVLPRLMPISGLEALALFASAIVAVLFVVVRGQFASVFKSTVAFWFIIMTYIGVNYVLGIGLHSYGFGTGAVVHYMMLTGSIDLLLIGLLTLVYLARTHKLSLAPRVAPAT